MKIAFHFTAKERQWVITEILKNSKDPLHCCLLWWDFTFYWKDTSKVKRTGENVCASGTGECDAVYHPSELSECTLVLMDEYLQKVCFFCGVECLLNAIVFLTLNKNNIVSVTRVFQSETCAMSFCTCRPFPKGSHNAAARTTGNKPYKDSNPWNLFHHVPIWLSYANVMLYIPPCCLF